MTLRDPGAGRERSARIAQSQMAFGLVNGATKFAPKPRLESFATAKIIQRLAIPSKPIENFAANEAQDRFFV